MRIENGVGVGPDHRMLRSRVGTSGTASISSRLRRGYYDYRRRALATFVPERVWPTHVTLSGVQVPVRGQSFSFGVKRLLVRKEYEAPEREMIRDVIEPGMTVFEMGSSIGVVTAVIADAVGASGRVIAVEASQQLVQTSRQWLPKGNVEVIWGFGFPVSQVPRGLAVHSFDGSSGSLGGTVAMTIDTVPGGEASADEAVWDVSRLSRQFSAQPDALVVDIEGAEILLTAVDPAFPPSLKHVVIELHPAKYEDGIRDQERVINALIAAGYVQRDERSGTYWFHRSESAGQPNSAGGTPGAT